MRIAHFGDTHIKNLKYHYEYRQAFEEIYKTSYWGSKDSVSGVGSTLNYTRPLREWLIKKINDLNMSSSRSEDAINFINSIKLKKTLIKLFFAIIGIKPNKSLCLKLICVPTIGCVFDFESVSENCNTPHKFDVSEMPNDFILLFLQNFSRSSILIAPSQIEY